MDEQLLQNIHALRAQVLCRAWEARPHMAFELHDSVRQEADRNWRNTGHTSSIGSVRHTEVSTGPLLPKNPNLDGQGMSSSKDASNSGIRSALL